MRQLHAPILPPAHKRGDAVLIQGKLHRYLGSGRFTSAYLNGTTKRVVLYTYFDDPSKDVVIEARQRAGCPYAKRHLPPIEYLRSTEDRGHTVKVYEAKSWPRPMMTWETDEREWMRWGVKGTRTEKDIHRLREAHKIARQIFPEDFTEKAQVNEFNKVVIGQADHLRVSVTVIDTLECLYDAAAESNHFIMFDSFRPTNLGLTRSYQLVLVDPMFDYELLDKTHREHRRTTMANF